MVTEIFAVSIEPKTGGYYIASHHYNYGSPVYIYDDVETIICKLKYGI